jgi:hypothetical protein
MYKNSAEGLPPRPEGQGFRPRSDWMNERWRRVMKALKGYEVKSVSAALALLTANGCSGPGNERTETCGVTEESLYPTGTLWPTGFSCDPLGPSLLYARFHAAARLSDGAK